MNRRRSRWLTYSILAVVAVGLGAFGYLVWLEWSMREPPNYSEIEPGLFMGGHVDEPPSGTTAVLNLCMWHDPYRVEYHREVPIKDSAPAPDLEWLREQVDFVAKHRNEGRVVYVHCLQGVSRSGLVTLAYLMRKHGWTLDEAMRFAKERRPGIRPNPAFRELLENWETSLR